MSVIATFNTFEIGDNNRTKTILRIGVSRLNYSSTLFCLTTLKFPIVQFQPPVTANGSDKFSQKLLKYFQWQNIFWNANK